MKIGYLMQEGGPDVRQKPLTGPANHVKKIYRELQSLGHDMSFLARYGGKIYQSYDLVTFKPVIVRRYDLGVCRIFEKVVRGAQSRLAIPYLNLFESLRFAEACQQELSNRDLYFERMGWMGYGVGLAARRMRIPLVLEVNNGDFITELERLGVAPTGLQRWLAIKLMRAAVKRADHAIATGDGHRQRYIEWWKIDPKTVTTIENGSEIVGLLKREELSVFCAGNEDSRIITVVFVGAFEPWHGIMILLSAIMKVNTINPNVRLVLIGSGTLWDQVNRQILELNLADIVHLTGQMEIKKVAEYLSIADIGVAPYCGWMEYSGLKLFDYKSAGLAIVASGQNGQPATIKQGETGLIVPPCEEDALANAILKLAGDQELRRKLGQNARLEAERFHTWQHTAQQIEDVFAMVMDRQ